MPGERKVSSLVDVTYEELYRVLTGEHERFQGGRQDTILGYLDVRLDRLRNISAPFGKPSEASRMTLESGSVTVDSMTLTADRNDIKAATTISAKFDICQVQALILLKLFLYNGGLHQASDADVADMDDRFTPFYYAERLHLFRCLIPLFREEVNEQQWLYPVSAKFMPKLVPDARKFVDALLEEFEAKLQAPVPKAMMASVKNATQWAKQNAKEQLVLLEVLFWAMFGSVPRDGRTVERVYRSAYSTTMGTSQANGTLLLDAEGQQLRQDMAATWMLIMIEVLELENFADPTFLEISDTPANQDTYVSSPESLQRIHNLVMAGDNSMFSLTFMAWSLVLTKLAEKMQGMNQVPASYVPFLQVLVGGTGTKDREPITTAMARASLDGGDLFILLNELLTNSPLFVASLAWKRDSAVTDTNPIAFRSVLKGFLITMLDIIPVESISNFYTLVDIWVALFGRSEVDSIFLLCHQYWQVDWHQGPSRRAIFDVARARFPIHFAPLLKLCRSMAACGFLDTDPLTTTSDSQPVRYEEQNECAQNVFEYFNALPTYAQHITLNNESHRHYERQAERASRNGPMEIYYVNMHPLRLPGGSILPAGTHGRLVAGDEKTWVIVDWKHKHSGWKIISEVLTRYVNRKRLSGSSAGYEDVFFGKRQDTQTRTLRLDDIGMQMDDETETSAIIEALDLIRGTIQDHPRTAELLMDTLEDGFPVVSHTMTETAPPDLVQLTTMILEEALTAANPRRRSPAELVTSAVGVLAALLPVQGRSARVWLFLRSTSALFGNDRAPSAASNAFAAERVTGHYTMTLAVLNLVQELFDQAYSTITPENEELTRTKEEVLLRAARFIHTEIWVEHMTWKYAQLGDRFEIGRRVLRFYTNILEHSPPNVAERPFPRLSQAVADVWLFHASAASVMPLVASLTTGKSALDVLHKEQRVADIRKLVFLLQSALRLTRILLTQKQMSEVSTKASLLEQYLCTRSVSGGFSDLSAGGADPIDVLASYVKQIGAGPVVPLEAMRVLTCLCTSLSSVNPPPSTIMAHLQSPESTVAELVHIAREAFSPAPLRIAVWNFMALTVEKEPALGRLFITGTHFSVKDIKGKGRAIEGADTAKDSKRKVTGMQAALDTLKDWSTLWDVNPQLLSYVLGFLDAVWHRGLENKTILAPMRSDAAFWDRIAGAASCEKEPPPDCKATGMMTIDNVQHADLHHEVSSYAYRAVSQAHATNILGSDISMQVQENVGKATPERPMSFSKIHKWFKSDELNEVILHAANAPYNPQLFDEATKQLEEKYPGLTLDQVRLTEPANERELGDGFAFSLDHFKRRMDAYTPEADGMAIDRADDDILLQVYSINLNLSVTHGFSHLATAWQFLLHQVGPYVRGDTDARKHILEAYAAIAHDVAAEEFPGDMRAIVHGQRLGILLALLELAWFWSDEKDVSVQMFADVMANTRGILSNSAQPPAASFLGKNSVPFHQTLLQILFYCAKQSRNLLPQRKLVNADQRLRITTTIDAILALVIDGLRIVFLAIRNRADLDLDRDLELLVAVFEQCIRRDVNSSPSQWLARCRETDVVRESLEIYSKTDLSGLSDLPLLTMRKLPLYSPHIMRLHMALASVPEAAEMLAANGVLLAYSNCSISTAIRSGAIDVALPDLPGERSPAHRAYCSMLAVVAAVLLALGRETHYLDAEASGFVQLCSAQIVRTMSWTATDPISLATVEEMEQTVNVFHALAEGSQTSASGSRHVDQVLYAFKIHGLVLLQHVNHAVTHPRRVASLFEPVTPQDRLPEKEQSADPLQRPPIAHLLHRLLKLSGSIVSVLVVISRAESVMMRERDSWSAEEAIILPQNKVVLGERASLGTLLELGNCTLDQLRDLLTKAVSVGPAAKGKTSLPGMYDTRESVHAGIAVARRTLEVVLTYSATQLALYLNKSDHDVASRDADFDESQQSSMEVSTATKAADRLRRGLISDTVDDLESLMQKAKPLMEKSDTTLGKSMVNVSQILENFFRNHVVGPAKAL
ncbi:nucleoporin subcomplex protein binding to Pom34-domain-containing protein [Schizophyllum amplum]|uniref:Nucleoporin subcomplex protein binding to Pom34-domain-containing protein n=1 Tax=Schizophyllum amplum TaxID=97359 RepID=A0A550CSX4_9AGAR|nr:nucleoporin subcomplex protein binding to Pom34-domain-containing protein [Auriculariopsis ampla]